MRLFLLLLVATPIAAQVMRGKVMMPDGAPPPQRAIIERVCTGSTPLQEALAGKQGEFYWRIPNDRLVLRGDSLVRCYLRARLKDLVSDRVDVQDPRVLSNLQLPTMVLRPAGDRGGGPRFTAPIAKRWDAALRAFRAEQFAEAEKGALEVAAAAPQFAAAWNAAGLARDAQKKWPEAREAFRKAIALDSTSPDYRVALSRVELQMGAYADAARTAEEAIRADTARRFPAAELNLGIARYGLGDREGARVHWERYLEIAPEAPSAALVRLKLSEMRGPAAAPADVEALLAEPPPQAFSGALEAPAPGGRKALAAVARLSPVPPASTFFLEYCRAVAAQTSRMHDDAIPKYTTVLREYIANVSRLADLGERRDGRSVLRLSLADGLTETALGLLGWRIVETRGKKTVEPGDLPEDGARQMIPRALGIDELSMKKTLEAGDVFELRIESETASIAGGAAWNSELRGFPTLPGGIAEAFVRDPKLARAYAGLASLPAGLAASLVKEMGLRALVKQHAALWLFTDAFHVENGSASVPGGAAAEPVWEKLAGASPRAPVKFFQALLTRDRGRVAAFYAALARADDAHRKFFTATASRAEQWLAWYAATDDLRDGVGVAPPGWASRVFAVLPLDGVDGIPADLEARVAVAELAHRRGRPLDRESAGLLSRNFDEWRALFPYFEAAPGLGAADFEALERFTRDLSARPGPEHETLLAQWHSAVALILLGRRSGALDDAAAARAFSALCRSGDAVATLRDLAGNDLDAGVKTTLLRLTAHRAAAFDRVRELQDAPALNQAAASGNPRVIAAALAGAVYAATLGPDVLLVNEDRGLLRKHVFAPRPPRLFAPSSFAGSHFTGGFGGFESVARRLSKAGAIPAEAAAPAADATPSDAPETVFRASGRLVEVNATVTDERGRLLEGLRADQFAIYENGRALPIVAYENEAAPLSCVLLLDTSQSMDSSIAALKSAALRLIGGLRASDAVAVYSLTGGISELQPFTTDKQAAMRAVLGAELGELTALYDGLVRVNRDLAGRTGKKVIVVLTDGEDTASALSAETAILRAKTAGVPIYTIAQGHAIRESSLLKELQGISQATGGKAFSIGSASEIGPVFERVLEDLLHGYLLAFAPPASDAPGWRAIQVTLRRAGKVRAREGYFPE